MSASKPPHPALRLLLLVLAWWFAAMSHNPVVRLEGRLGLSPSPLEKLAGIRGPFSGMTEGFYQLARGSVDGAVNANVLTPLVALTMIACISLWWRPRLVTRLQEATFFLAVVCATIVVNTWH